MTKDFSFALESLSLCRYSSVSAAKSLGPSDDRSSTIDSTSLRKQERGNQEAHLITIAISVDCAAVSAESRAVCNAVLEISCPSEMSALNCSFFSSRRNSINLENFP